MSNCSEGLSVRTRHTRLSVEALEPREVPAVVTTALDTDDADRPNGDFIGADGLLSLREAIEMTNSKGGSITFGGPGTISLNDPLPELTRATSIVGATLPDGKPGVVIEGGFFNGMVFRAGGTAKNLVIHGYGTSGLIFNGVGRVENCFIGTDAAGTSAVPNGQTGVVLNKGGTVLKSVISGNSGAGILVAGTTALIENNFIGTNFNGTADLGNGAQGVILRGSLAVVRNNIISGNGSEGVWIDGSAAKSNRVIGNKIGVAANGTTPLENTLGVFVSNKATLNIIGGTATTNRNIIAGNSDDGIRLELAGITNRIQGNFIGVDVTGTIARPNGGDGVEILESLSNVVGGSAVGTRNIIAGNTGVGVRIIGLSGIPASKNVVSGNFIGLDANGADLGHSIGIMLERFATNNTIGGITALARNIISGNDAGIRISDLGTSGNKVQGNYIGTDVTGKLARPNEVGVVVAAGASNNTVGGAAAGARNLISANTTVGILIADLETFENKVIGNRIGTDVAGMAALPNLEDGIRIDKSVRNTIGGNIAGSRNLISGNGDEGIEIIGNPFISEAHLNVVIGNYVGTNALGTAALANAGNGISIVDGRADRIGGVLAGDRNLISGNAGHGIHLEGESTSNRIEGNAIGTNAARTAAIGNTIGVHFVGSGAGNRIGGTIANSGNTIAGNRANGVSIANTRVDLFRNRIGLDPTGKTLSNGGHGIVMLNTNDNTIGGGANYNVVRFNAVDGVKLDGGSRNRISANRLSDNGGLGIHLVNGANNSFGGPLINTASATSTKITLQGTLMNFGSQTVTLELFANIAADPSGIGEGAAYIGSVTLTASAIGAFTAVFTAALPVGYRWLSLTATDADGNTSAFSICKQV